MPVTTLEFITEPSDTQVNSTILPAVRVALKDDNGDIVVTATDEVTIAIEDNPGAGTLSGTLTKRAVAGIATFSNLRINQVGNDYTLRATANPSTGSGLDPNENGATLWLFGSDPSFAALGDGDKVGESGVMPWPNRADAIVGDEWVSLSGEIQRPAYRLISGPNDEPYLEFGGEPTTDQLNGNSGGAYFAADAYHVFIVVRPDATEVPLIFSGPDVALNVEGSRFEWRHLDAAFVASEVTSASGISVGTWYLVEMSFGLGTLALRVNNASPVTMLGVGDLGFAVALQMRVHGPCGIAELIAFDQRLSHELATAYRTSLMTKYGL